MSDPLNQFMNAIAAGDDELTEEAVAALARMGDAAVTAIKRLYARGNPDERWWAARSLAALRTPQATDLLIEVLTDPDPDVRACAVVGLASVRPAAALDGLANSLSDPSPYVARLAADALAQFGEAATAVLLRALEADDPSARVGAARALRTTQPEEAIPALVAALDDPSAAVSHYAAEALERMGVGMVYFLP